MTDSTFHHRDRIYEKPHLYKVCDDCSSLNYHSNEYCHKCGDRLDTVKTGDNVHLFLDEEAEYVETLNEEENMLVSEVRKRKEGYIEVQ
jgi:hypothetical protein